MNSGSFTRERSIDEKVLSDLLRQFSPLLCWKVGLFYGSMVYFEMGDKLEERRLGGSIDIVGSATLTLLGDNWWIHDHGKEIARSIDISRDVVESDLADKFIGKTLSEIRLDEIEKVVFISFSQDMDIRVDPSDTPLSKMDDRDDSMTLDLPNGEIVYYHPAKELRIADVVNKTKHADWIAKSEKDSASS